MPCLKLFSFFRDVPFVIVVKLLLTRNATKTQVPVYVNLEFRDPSADVVMLNPGIWDPMVCNF